MIHRDFSSFEMKATCDNEQKRNENKTTTKTVYQIHELCVEKLMESNFSVDGLIYCNYDKKHHLHIILFCIFMVIAKESILINPNDFFGLNFD